MLWYESFDRLRSQRLRVLSDEPMSRHTTFRIGGPARRMAFPETESELAALLDLAVREGYPYTVIGNGSNVLSPDEGLDRLVINTSRVDTVTVVGNAVHALAGATMARVANAAQRAGLTGMEFAHGIPGTLGGGVFMNAGAYGGELCQVVRSVRAWFPGEGIVTLMGGECRFGYRHSVFSEKPGVVLFVEMELTAGDSAAIKAKMEELAARRRSSQPLELPSAGSTFKRPEGYYAGTLIDQCGLKGERVGGAQVSEKHAGFIVNTGGATCADVLGLIARIQETVRERTGVALEPEVRILRG